MENIFTEITLLLSLTVLVAWVAKLLKQPMIVAYIFAGIAAGPLFFNIVHKSAEQFSIFSQLGVILLLFVVGLSLNFNYLKKIGKMAVIGGFGQAIFTAIFGYTILSYLGFSHISSIYLAIAITFSSTIIITKLLGDKKQTDSLYGRHTIGLMLVQDVIAVLVMIFVSSASEGLAIGESILKLGVGGFMLISGTIVMAKYILPFILRRIAESAEFLFLFSLAWCFLLAFAAKQIGFSLEVGAVVAGIALGSSPYQPEINARITPVRDFFLIIFFILLGAELDLSTISSVILPGSMLALFILIGNPFILYMVYRRMRFTHKNSLFIGLTAAQVSEFGFVLLYIGNQLGHIGQMEIATFTFVAITTIFMSAYIITNNEKVFKFIHPVLSLISKKDYEQKEEEAPVYDTWVIGYHRIGWNIVNSLKEKGESFAVIDFDPSVMEELKKENIPGYFLDVGDVDLLSELPLDKAKMIISTIPSIESQLTLLRHVKRHNPETRIIVNAPEAKYIESLYEAGADYVMTPHLLGGKWISNLIYEGKINKENLEDLRSQQKEEMSRGMPINTL